MVHTNDVLQALSTIIDPDVQKDIVSLGFIKNLKIQEDKVTFELQLTTPAGPVKQEFQKQAEEAVLAIPGVRTVKITVAAPEKRTAATVPGSALTNVRSIIAISSCKGGVGKSTMAAGLALELANRGHKVGLVDADIHGPSIPALFGLTGQSVRVTEQQRLIPLEVHGLKIMSFGFLLGDAPAVMRGPLVSRYIQQLLHFTEWGELDYLFIDMPPGTGDVQLTITQSVQLSGAVIVTTRQTLSLIDVQRGILMFEKVAVPLLGVIENMSYFICDQCRKKHFIFGGGEKTQLEERFGLETLAEIPLLPELSRSIDPSVKNEFLAAAADQVVRALEKITLRQLTVPAVQVDAQHIVLRWNNGEEWKVNNRQLRLSCRCALCVDELSGKILLNPDKIRPDIAPKEITPLGNYALGITWNDGHASGIYPYKKIKELAKSV